MIIGPAYKRLSPNPQVAGTMLFLFLAVAASGFVVCCGAFLLVDAYSPLPYWDQWEFTSPKTVLIRYFHQHNEHRIFLTKTVILVDQIVFGGSSRFNLFIIYLTQALHSCGLLALAYRAGLRSIAELTLAALLVTSAAFTTHQYDNLTWGFQTQFVLVFSLATAAFLALSRYAENRSPLALVLASGSSILATIEMANGVIVSLVLVVLGLVLRIDRRAILLLSLAAALIVGVYVYTYTPVGHHSQAFESVSQPFRLAGYLLVYIGGPSAQTLTSSLSGRLLTPVVSELQLALLCGGAVLCVNITIFFILLKRTHVYAAQWALLSVNAFVIATAGITGLGRLGFGLEQALSSRYATGGAIIFAVTFVLILSCLAPLRIGRSRTTIAAAVCALILVLTALAQPRFIDRAEQRRIRSDFATTALLAGVKDMEALGSAFQHLNYVLEGAEVMRQYRTSIFGEPWSQWRGVNVSEVVPATDAVCAGRIDQPQPLGDTQPRGGRIFGTVILSPMEIRPRILLVDKQQTIVGYAFVNSRFENILRYRSSRKSPMSVSWQGHMLFSEAPFPDAVVIDRQGRSICRIRLHAISNDKPS